MSECGFQYAESDSNLYLLYDKDGCISLALYVDDLVIAESNTRKMEKVKAWLQVRFKMKQLGPLAYCLGVQVLRNCAKGLIDLHQTKYLSDILIRFNLSAAKPMSTPLAASVKLSFEDQPATDQEKLEMQSVPYRQAIGCLIYLSVWTRFDISKATQETTQHSQNPSPKHWSVVKRVYRYLSGTRSHGLVYQGKGTRKLSLIGWSDADWAGDLNQRRSVVVFVFTVNE